MDAAAGDLADGAGPYPVVDGHNDLLWAARLQVDYDFDRLDLAVPQPTVATDLPRLRAGGVAGQFWSVYVPSTLPADAAVAQTLEQVEAGLRMVERYGDALGLARSADEIEAVAASGRVASLFGAEGGQSIGCSVGVLRVLHRLGVRYLTLTHNDNTPWADSATDVPAVGGLSAFGREVVREMNRIGMLVDLSHVHELTMRAALETSQAPVVFSHSSSRAVTDVPRNVPDDVLASMAAGGGVCMVTFVPEFVNDDVARWRDGAAAAAALEGVSSSDFVAFLAFSQRYGAVHPKPDATLDDVVRHVEHVREVAGVDHVGVGGDYDGTDTYPLGLADVSSYPRLFAALGDQGWSATDLRKLAGGNVIRVLRDAEDVARDLSSSRGPSLATVDALDGPARPGVPVR